MNLIFFYQGTLRKWKKYQTWQRTFFMTRPWLLRLKNVIRCLNKGRDTTIPNVVHCNRNFPCFNRKRKKKLKHLKKIHINRRLTLQIVLYYKLLLKLKSYINDLGSVDILFHYISADLDLLIDLISTYVPIQYSPFKKDNWHI